MSMTPFEIRLELLKMSKDMLEQEYFVKKETTHNNWQVETENARIAGQTLPKQPDFPSYPTETEIIAKAQTLNGFVSQIPQDVKTSTKK